MALLERCHCIPGASGTHGARSQICTPETITGVYRGAATGPGCERALQDDTANPPGSAFPRPDAPHRTNLLLGTRLARLDHRTALIYSSALGSRVWIGLYIVYLREWFSVFPRQQIMVLEMQFLHANLALALARIHAFLGLPPAPSGGNGGVGGGGGRVGGGVGGQGTTMPKFVPVSSSTARMDPKTSGVLRRFYGPFNRALADITGDEAFRWDLVESSGGGSLRSTNAGVMGPTGPF